MGLLTDIPNELLAGACSHLGQADLAHVCLVSHHLRSVAEPLLYHEVSLSTVNTDRPLFEQFLGTIVRRPILADHVHFLSMMWFRAVNIITLSRASIDPLSGTFILQPQFAPPPSRHGGSIQLLMCLLPRLEVVELAPAGSLDIFSELLNHADGTRLQHLREVRYISGDVTRCMSNKTLISLLMLPSIRRIDVRLGADELPAAAVSTHKSAVTDLRFISPISPVTLGRIVEYSRALTHFTYQRITIETINNQQIGLALGSTVGTLQYLALNINLNVGAHGRPITGDRGTCFNLGTLREWPVLWVVKSPLRLLLGGHSDTTLRLADVLPAVIRELQIELDFNWTPKEIYDELYGVLKLKEVGEFQQLAVIALPYQSTSVPLDLVGQCRHVGVELVFRELRTQL